MRNNGVLDFIRNATGGALSYIMFAEGAAVGVTTMPLVLLLVTGAVLCILGGLGSYGRSRGEKKWTRNGLLTTVLLMTTLGFSVGAGVAVVCEIYEISNLLVLLVCGAVGIFGLDIIQKFPSIGPLWRAIKRAFTAFKEEMDDDV